MVVQRSMQEIDMLMCKCLFDVHRAINHSILKISFIDNK